MAQYKESCGIKRQREPVRKLTEWPPIISLVKNGNGRLPKIVFPRQSELPGHFGIPLGVYLPEVLGHRTGTKQKKNKES
jgi:hypothetical protein